MLPADPEMRIAVDPGVIGEIYVRTDFIFSEYLGRKNLTSESFVNNYFATGDLGYIDNDGYLYFKGRKNECMKIGGVNIYCKDIEECINEIN